MTKELLKAFKRYSTFSVTSHMNLEGDALGSQIAMYALLKKIGKKVWMINQDPVPPSYTFLPFSGCIRTKPPAAVPDAAVVVDCSDLFRTGKVGGYISKSGLVINIDHHISNSRFGGINWVEHNVSSTCEMLYKICTQLKVLDEKIALCLYTGMFTDTGSFSFSNATGRTHAIISKLLDFDIAPQKVYQAVYSVYAPEDIRLVGRLITRVRQDRNGQVAWLSVADWPKEPKVDLTETIFSVMRLIKGPGVLVLFKRVGRNRVRVNFRSRGNFDVNKAAKAFGGGGHATASGTTVQGSLPVVEKDVIGYIRKRMPACRQAGSNG